MNAAKIILISGCTSAVIDILTTMAITSAQGMPPRRLLQFIASGALGDASFEGGDKTRYSALRFTLSSRFRLPRPISRPALHSTPSHITRSSLDCSSVRQCRSF